jgi:cytochrome c oxidase assembly protein subunit 11
MRPPPVVLNAGKNARVAALAAVVSFGMLGLAYASVPLYSLFCQVTGFGGTTQRADQAPAAAAAAEVSVRFDANTAGSLGWAFQAEQQVMKIKLGEQHLAYYSARNFSDKAVTGTAVFNVTPPEAGVYFNKIQCFCFTEQTLKPGETARFPVDFFVDPDMLNDPDAKSISEITLSYTFFPVEKNNAVSAAAIPADQTMN